MAKKKFDYFNYFENVSSIICNAAEYLNDTLQNYDAGTLNQKIDELHQIEHEADCMKHDMTKILAHEFITPIEREDIVAMAQKLDTVVDDIEDILLRVYMYNVTALNETTIAFSKTILSCTKALDIVIHEFKNFKKADRIREHIISVNNYESEGDKLLVEGIRNLSISQCSDRELFVWTDIYRHMERCLDSCEDIADIIEEVVMKNT